MRRLDRTLQYTHGVSQKRMALGLGKSRSPLRYEPIMPKKDAPLKLWIEEITRTRVRYGYKRVHALLLCEGDRLPTVH